MNRKLRRKSILDISKRHLNLLIAQESEIICDSFLNTTGALHKDDFEYSQCLNNSSKINSCMANNRNEICIANENGTIYENDINISTTYKNDEYLQLNKTDSEQSCESISFDSISNVSENANAMTDNDFEHRFAVWATEHQITHVALRALIQTLKQHSCFSNLSIDARSLLKTPRRLDIRMVTPGTYYHFGLLRSVLHVLTSIKDYTDCVRITVNVDGLPISKSSSQQFWPILGSVIPYDYVFLIGLYYGTPAFKSILQNNVYTNFIVLHVIVRILSSQDLNEYLSYAQDLILFFIKTFMRLYGIRNMSHNVHSLIYFVDDVKIYRPLDKFSAFKFENYMQMLKKYVRKADRPLQQVVRRCIEKEMNSDLSSSTILSQSVVTNPIVTSLHYDGPLLFNCNNPQYKIKYKGMTLKAGTVADSCCGLNCNAIVVIKNIAYCTKQNIPVIIGYEFLEKNDLFHIPCPSSILGIYIVHLYSALKSWPLKDVIRKYVQLPYSENKYVVFPLIHM